LISLINITKDTKNHSQCQVLFIWKGDYIGVPQNKIPYSCGFAPPHYCKIPCFWGFLRVGGKVGLRLRIRKRSRLRSSIGKRSSFMFKSFKDMPIWKVAMEIAEVIFKLTDNLL